MSRSYAMTLKRPHETLGLPLPVGRKIGEAGKIGWFAFLGSVLAACVGIYLFEINASAAKTYELRAYEKRMERLNEAVSALESRLADMQSIRAMEERIKELGYVSVERMDFIDAPYGFAMAK